ncbi:MAG: peptidylprolyl isomerase [Evtepia sp.]
MIKKCKRFLGITLAAALLVTTLGGCDINEYDPVQEIMGYSGKTTFMTVDGEKVTAADYFFWLAQSGDYIGSFFAQQGTEDIPWDQQLDENNTVSAYLKNEALNTAKLYRIVETKAKESGYKFTNEDMAALKEEEAAALKQAGGQETYDKMLKQMCITSKGMHKMSQVSALYSHLENGMFQTVDDTGAVAEGLQTYVKDNDLLRAKHILLAKADPTTNEPYAAEKIAEQKTLADDLLQQINAAENPTELFNQLMKDKNEDPGMAQSPDGYVFMKDQMVPEFEAATRALEIGAISGVVESEFGYHIILRLDPSEDKQVQSDWRGTEMDAVLQKWMEEAVVETTAEYDAMEAKVFYEGLQTFRQTLETPAESTTTPDDTTTQPTQPNEEPKSGGDVPPTDVPTTTPPVDAPPATGDTTDAPPVDPATGDTADAPPADAPTTPPAN